MSLLFYLHWFGTALFTAKKAALRWCHAAARCCQMLPGMAKCFDIKQLDCIPWMGPVSMQGKALCDLPQL